MFSAAQTAISLFLVKTPHRDFRHAHFDGRSPLAAIYIRVARRRDSARDGELPLDARAFSTRDGVGKNTGNIITFIKRVPLHNSYCIHPYCA